jgi:hypothetical protein
MTKGQENIVKVTQSGIQQAIYGHPNGLALALRLELALYFGLRIKGRISNRFRVWIKFRINVRERIKVRINTRFRVWIRFKINVRVRIKFRIRVMVRNRIDVVQLPGHSTGITQC